MARGKWSIQAAKDHFSEVVDAARKEPQIVTEHGKPAVVVIAVEEYERLRRFERLEAATFIDHLLAIPQGGEDFERIDAELRDVEF